MTIETPQMRATLWDNRSALEGAGNTIRGLTHSLDLGKEGIGMKPTRTCSVEDCDCPVFQVTKALCAKHYARLRRYGSPSGRPPRRAKDLAGRKFGRLTVIKETSPNHWLVRCECGITADYVRTWSLTSGGTAGCGQGSCAAAAKEVVGYGGAHARVARERGSASIWTCERCGGPAEEWAYDHEDSESIKCPSTGNEYSLDVTHYQPMCIKCHSAFDRAFRLACQGMPRPERHVSRELEDR